MNMALDLLNCSILKTVNTFFYNLFPKKYGCNTGPDNTPIKFDQSSINHKDLTVSATFI